MKKIGDVTSTADKNGEWTNGNVAAGIAPTILEAGWLNSVQREILGVLTKAGIQQDKNNDTQLAEAISKIISGGDYATKTEVNSKLAKDQNGADIQDKPKFIENLGIPNPFLIRENALSAATDLNTLGGDSGRGIYSQPAHAGATLAKNYPEATAGVLLVLPSAFGGMQIYVTYNGVIWQRQSSNTWNGSGPWGIWIKAPTGEDLDKRQPLDTTLTALAGLPTGANKLPYFTGDDAAGQTDLTQVGRDIIGKGDIASVISYLGMNSGFGWVNLPGGKILQWNRGNTGDGGARFSFPIPFPNQCHGVLATPFMSIDGTIINAGTSIATIFVSSATINKTGFFAKYAAGASSNEFFWLSIGE
ncbi:pyocin knob domain-containing protein [Morganella morganii]|uniref:pyocin knob domain-containing protein n=1 Tax=Morganella morganii TaxID=582 RepID=UPI0032D9D8FB